MYRATAIQNGTNDRVKAEAETPEAARLALVGSAYGVKPGTIDVYKIPEAKE